MQPPADALRFFRSLPPAHPLPVAGFGIVLAASMLLFVSGVPYGAGVVAPLFFLQGLAVSSGFRGPARRGHYDLLLTAGHSRLRTGLAHWFMSMLPGTVCWLAMGCAEALMSRPPQITMTPGTAAGMLLVSTLPWALTVPFPRLSGALAWMLVLMMTFSMLPRQVLDVVNGIDGSTDMSVQVVAVLLCPWLLAGRDLVPADLLSLAVATAADVAAMGTALWWIGRADVPLEAAQ